MATDMSEVIRQLMQDRNMSEELILKTIENTLLAAYKRRYGNADNAVVRFNDDNREVSIYAKKRIVDSDNFYDPISEIELEDAKELNPDAEINDELLIEVDPQDFDRSSVQSAKQTAHQSIREIQKDSLYAEFKDKIGEIIIGYYQRERNGTVFVDIGKIEGKLLKKYQSPREEFHVNDRIKSLIVEVTKNQNGLEVILSRTHTDFVRAIFELEVPEVYDKVVEIHKIVREPGYRTKLAVYSNRDDVDPVGACVGLKGVRILAVIKELEGEKIDILKYDPDPRKFIKNALSPAEVRDVIILDEAKHQALAVVSESQLSLAIGKQGLNVRLANRLVDWNIDVKTDAQFGEMDIAAESRRAVSQLFGDGEDDYGEEYTLVSQLPGVGPAVAALLRENGKDFIEDFLSIAEEELAEIGISKEQQEALKGIIEEHIEIVEEEYSGDASGGSGDEPEEEADDAPELPQGSEAEEYECPECSSKITVDMASCPNCGIGLSFEYEDDNM
ncbi:MAG: transcription termination factor NusA [Treponema sp.]|nr:transcription termination factor NusA [Treponema sp.]